MTLAEMTALSAVDMDEFYAEIIVYVAKNDKNKKKMPFKIRWLGYKLDGDTWDEFDTQSNDEELKAAVSKR
jgi:hypothetical protein